jgi:HSP20 family protein
MPLRAAQRENIAAGKTALQCTHSGKPEEGVMRLTRWEPFREMDDFFRGFSPLFGQSLTPRVGESMHEFMPLADITERDKEYLIKIDLPEVKKEDVKVLVDEGVLKISGERKIEKEVKGEKVHRTERFFGEFERSFVLPEDIDAKHIRAESKDGVLMIHLPKVDVPKARPLAITIQ